MSVTASIDDEMASPLSSALYTFMLSPGADISTSTTNKRDEVVSSVSDSPSESQLSDSSVVYTQLTVKNTMNSSLPVSDNVLSPFSFMESLMMGSPSTDDNSTLLTTGVNQSNSSLNDSISPCSSNEVSTSLSSDSGIADSDIDSSQNTEKPVAKKRRRCKRKSISDGMADSDSNQNIEPPVVKKHRKNKPPDGDLLPPCRVCEAKASGLHYGANTCEPCKGFFRRSIVKIIKNKGEYKCLKTGTCNLVGTGKRSMCSYCRYQKCLEVGMSQDAIKIGRYTYEKRTSDINEVNLLKHGKTPDSVVTCDPVAPAEDLDVFNLVQTLISIEEDFIDDFRKSFEPDGLLPQQQSVYEKYMQKIEIFGNLGALPWSVYEDFLKTTGIELDNRKKKMMFIARRMEEGIRNMITFARHIPGYCDLNIADQLTLLKAGYIEFWFLAFHTRLNADLNVIASTNKVAQATGFPGVHKNEMSTIPKGKYLEKIFEFAATMQKCHLTVEEVALSQSIVLTFSDRCTLVEPEKVEEIQWRLVNNLLSIVKKRYKNPNERLWQIFDKFIMLRNLNIECREIIKDRGKWEVMKNHPLVLEMINCLE